MSLCNFSQPQHFLRGLSNGADLSAFALGAENSYIHFRLRQDGPIPSSPELQNILEDLAAYYWRRYQLNAQLKKALDQFTQSILYNKDIVFNDIELHLRHKELPLVKYYAAVAASGGQIDRAEIWKAHRAQCRVLCMALYEKKRRPHANVCYGVDSALVSDPCTQQCLHYARNAKATSFCSNKWWYRVVALPW